MAAQDMRKASLAVSGTLAVAGKAVLRNLVTNQLLVKQEAPSLPLSVVPVGRFNLFNYDANKITFDDSVIPDNTMSSRYAYFISNGQLALTNDNAAVSVNLTGQGTAGAADPPNYVHGVQVFFAAVCPNANIFPDLPRISAKVFSKISLHATVEGSPVPLRSSKEYARPDIFLQPDGLSGVVLEILFDEPLEPTERFSVSVDFYFSTAELLEQGITSGQVIGIRYGSGILNLLVSPQS